MINGRLNSFIMLLVVIAAVPLLVAVVWATDRDPPMRNYRADLIYDGAKGELLYDVSFFIDRDCLVQIRDEITGRRLDLSPTHGPLNTPKGDTRLRFSRPTHLLDAGDYQMRIFLSFWCNPLQEMMNWPIVQQEKVRFSVP